MLYGSVFIDKLKKEYLLKDLCEKLFIHYIYILTGEVNREDNGY